MLRNTFCNALYGFIRCMNSSRDLTTQQQKSGEKGIRVLQGTFSSQTLRYNDLESKNSIFWLARETCAG